MVEAIIYILRTGIPWRDLPQDFGPWSSVYTRWRRWCINGLWRRMIQILSRRAKGKLRFIDSSFVKVHQDAANPAEGQEFQAFGRTKGGINTKITAWVDGAGRAVSVALAPGNEPDISALERSDWPDIKGTTVVADKGYDSDELRELLRKQKARPCIPPRSNRVNPDSWNRGYYRRRHKVENLFQRIKRLRRIATRYEKCDTYYLAFVQLAAIVDWVKK